jgi:hypothetical protein
MADEEKRQAEQSVKAVKQSDDEPMLYCPVCSTRLVQDHCKLVCEKCGYFMSCADYY